jgi:hypothetical protein
MKSFDLRRHFLRSQRIVQPQPQLVDDPALPHQRLGQTGQRIDLPLVDALQSGPKDANDCS